MLADPIRPAGRRRALVASEISEITDELPQVVSFFLHFLSCLRLDMCRLCTEVRKEPFPSVVADSIGLPLWCGMVQSICANAKIHRRFSNPEGLNRTALISQTLDQKRSKGCV